MSKTSAMKAPIVLVCGWMNASPRGVKKYAEMYEQLGYRAITLNSTVSHLFLDPKRIQLKPAKELIQQSSELVIIPHMISNGGCISWYSIQQHLKNAGVSFHVPAMIFDSAPNSKRGFLAYPETSTQALDALTDTIQNPIQRHVIQFGLCITWLAVLARWGFIGAPDPLQRNFAKLIEEDAAIPKLFLYSSGDKLVTAQEIEKSISSARALGTSVDTLNFKESKHVAHMLHDPELYMSTILEFFDKNKVTLPSTPKLQ